MWVPRPELSLSRFASSEWVGLRVSFTRTGGAPEKAKVESTASGWVTLRVSSDERVRKRSHELEVSAADAVTLPLRKPDPRKIGGGGGNDSSSDEGASAAAASAAAASRVAILSPPRSMGVALASPRSEPQRRAAAPDVVGSDSASQASFDRGGERSERSLLGEAVKLHEGPSAGRVGFIVSRDAATGKFLVRVDDVESLHARADFRRVSNYGAVLAALTGGIDSPNASGAGAGPRAARRMRSAIVPPLTTEHAAAAAAAAAPATSRKRREREGGSFTPAIERESRGPGRPRGRPSRAAGAAAAAVESSDSEDESDDESSDDARAMPPPPPRAPASARRGAQAAAVTAPAVSTEAMQQRELPRRGVATTTGQTVVAARANAPYPIIAFLDPATGVQYADVTQHEWFTWPDQRVLLWPPLAAPPGVSIRKPARGEVTGAGWGWLRVRRLNGPEKGTTLLARPARARLDEDYEPIVDPPEPDETGERTVTREEILAAGLTPCVPRAGAPFVMPGGEFSGGESPDEDELNTGKARAAAPAPAAGGARGRGRSLSTTAAPGLSAAAPTGPDSDDGVDRKFRKMSRAARVRAARLARAAGSSTTQGRGRRSGRTSDEDDNDDEDEDNDGGAGATLGGTGTAAGGSFVGSGGDESHAPLERERKRGFGVHSRARLEALVAEAEVLVGGGSGGAAKRPRPEPGALSDGVRRPRGGAAAALAPRVRTGPTPRRQRGACETDASQLMSLDGAAKDGGADGSSVGGESTGRGHGPAGDESSSDSEESDGDGGGRPRERRRVGGAVRRGSAFTRRRRRTALRRRRVDGGSGDEAAGGGAISGAAPSAAPAPPRGPRRFRDVIPIDIRTANYVRDALTRYSYAADPRTSLLPFSDRLDVPREGDPWHTIALERGWWLDDPASAASAAPAPSPPPSSTTRFYKLGAGRLQKLAASAAGRKSFDVKGRAAVRAAPPHESSSEEDALCESSWQPFGGSTTLESEARAHAARRVARAGGADRYCNSASVAANKPWLHSSDFRSDTVIDKAAARGSHRRPVYYGLWGLAAFSESSAHLPEADVGLASVVSTEGAAPPTVTADAAGARVLSRVPFAVPPTPDAATLYAFVRCRACGVAKEDARDLCWNAACAALGAAAARADAPRDTLIPDEKAALIPEWSLSRRAAEPRIAPLAPALSIPVPAIASLKEPASERIVAATVGLAAKDVCSAAAPAAGDSAAVVDSVALATIFSKSQRSRAALPLFYNLSANASARRSFIPPRAPPLRTPDQLPSTTQHAFPVWRPRARSEAIAAAAAAKEAAAAAINDAAGRGASQEMQRMPRRRVISSLAGLRNKRELSSLLDEVDRAAAMQAKIYHYDADPKSEESRIAAKERAAHAQYGDIDPYVAPTARVMLKGPLNSGVGVYDAAAGCTGTGALLLADRTRPLVPPTSTDEAANEDLIPPSVEAAWTALTTARLTATRDAVSLSALAFDAPTVYVGGGAKPRVMLHGDADDDAAVAVSLGTAPDPYELSYAAAVHAAEADRDRDAAETSAGTDVAIDLHSDAAAAKLLANTLPAYSTAALVDPSPAPPIGPTQSPGPPAAEETQLRLGYPWIRTHAAPADGAPQWSDAYAFRYFCTRRPLLEKEAQLDGADIANPGANQGATVAATLRFLATRTLPAVELADLTSTAAQALREAASRKSLAEAEADAAGGGLLQQQR